MNWRVAENISTFARYSRGGRVGGEKILRSPAVSPTTGELLIEDAAYDPVTQAEIGFKYKMSNIQAAIGCGQMERIDELVAGKRRVFKRYRQALSALPLAMNPEPPGTTNGYWMPTVVFDAGCGFDRELLLAEFRAENIDGRVFFWPLSTLPMFDCRPDHATSLSLSSRAINLPSYHDLEDESIDRVVQVVARHAGGRGP